VSSKDESAAASSSSSSAQVVKKRIVASQKEARASQDTNATDDNNDDESSVPVFEFCDTLKVKGTLGVGLLGVVVREQVGAMAARGRIAKLEQDCIDSYNASLDEGVTFFRHGRSLRAGSVGGGRRSRV
jgi:hypothetical protein